MSVNRWAVIWEPLPVAVWITVQIRSPGLCLLWAEHCARHPHRCCFTEPHNTPVKRLMQGPGFPADFVLGWHDGTCIRLPELQTHWPFWSFCLSMLSQPIPTLQLVLLITTSGSSCLLRAGDQCSSTGIRGTVRTIGSMGWGLPCLSPSGLGTWCGLNPNVLLERQSAA